MVNKFFRKGLVVVTIIFFIGGIFVPNINGIYTNNIGKSLIFKQNRNLIYGWNQQGKLLPSDGEIHDNFGWSVSISGEYAIVGSPDSIDLNGSAYIFQNIDNKWIEIVKLTISDIEHWGYYFGFSVSINGDYAIIGVPGNNSAYIFKKTNNLWIEEAKLIPSDYSDAFGYSVSINGEYALVGSFDDDNGMASGAAYIFKRYNDTWTEEAKLIASDGAAEDQFGVCVSLSGDYAIIGADGKKYGGTSPYGAAYIFKRDGTSWIEESKLNGSDVNEGDQFGMSVSLNGDYAIVGAPLGDDVYIFKRDGTNWIEEVKLRAPDINEEIHFGSSVSIYEDRIIIGAVDSSSAYIYRRNETNWIIEAKIVPSDFEKGDWFGLSASISDNYIVIGAPNGFDIDGKETGAAYIFEKNVNQPPKINIIKPERGLYIFNKKILPGIFWPTKIIGNITIEVNASDIDSGIEKVEFYINSKYMGNDTTEPYTFDWRWKKPSLFHWFIIKVIAYDYAGSINFDRMIVRKFL